MLNNILLYLKLVFQTKYSPSFMKKKVQALRAQRKRRLQKALSKARQYSKQRGK